MTEPSGTIGKKVRFEIAEHDVKLNAEAGIGVEYRISPRIGFVSEIAFDKIDRPQANYGTARVGINLAF